MRQSPDMNESNRSPSSGISINQGENNNNNNNNAPSHGRVVVQDDASSSLVSLDWTATTTNGQGEDESAYASPSLPPESGRNDEWVNNDEDDVAATNEPYHDTTTTGLLDEPSDCFTKQAAADSAFTQYHVYVNNDQDDMAVEIALYSAARPHMRAFHYAWGSFFVAFFTWFAMTPLLSEISKTLDLTHEDIWTSSVLAVTSSALTRSAIGPFNDKYGARWVMSMTLVAAGIPTVRMKKRTWVEFFSRRRYLILSRFRHSLYSLGFGGLGYSRCDQSVFGETLDWCGWFCLCHLPVLDIVCLYR